MTDAIEFDVRGLPISQGSTRAYTPKGWTHPVITSSAKGLKQWRRLVADVGQRYAPPEPWEGPVAMELRFRLPRPKGEKTERCEFVHPHKGPHRMVPVRTWPDKRPDLDKLQRAVLDALTYVFFGDDGQVVRILAEKDWGAPGVRIRLERVVGDPE